MKDQASLTQSEFRNIANSKTDQQTVTGQHLTRKKKSSSVYLAAD